MGRVCRLRYADIGNGSPCCRGPPSTRRCSCAAAPSESAPAEPHRLIDKHNWREGYRKVSCESADNRRACCSGAFPSGPVLRCWHEQRVNDQTKAQRWPFQPWARAARGVASTGSGGGLQTPGQHIRGPPPLPAWRVRDYGCPTGRVWPWRHRVAHQGLTCERTLAPTPGGGSGYSVRV